jgi:hypothetical protein
MKDLSQERGDWIWHMTIEGSWGESKRDKEWFDHFTDKAEGSSAKLVRFEMETNESLRYFFETPGVGNYPIMSTKPTFDKQQWANTMRGMYCHFEGL